MSIEGRKIRSLDSFNLDDLEAQWEKVRILSEFKKIGYLIQRVITAEWLIISAPFLVFILHSLLFWSWIIDDAGISFSYARNLSEGHGLVAQPDSAPVEGYSNPLWTLLLVPLFFFGMFDPVITPKVVSAFMVLTSFIVLSKTLQKIPEIRNLIIFAILFLLSINTAFVVWTTSGLENPLYVLLFCALLLCSVQSVASDKEGIRNGVISGLLAAGIALTRPEGVIFFGIYPLILLSKTLYNRDPLTKYPLSELLVYALSFSIVLGSYETFRWMYFDDLLPNTFYAKGGPSLSDLLSIITLQRSVVTELLGLLASVTGRFGAISLLGLVTVTVCFISTRRFRREYLVLSLFLVWTVFAFLLLPNDWMGEFRFATPFFIFFYAYGIALLHVFINHLNFRSVNRSILSILVVIALIGASLTIFVERSVAFAAHPTVPFDGVAERYAFRFNDYADQMDIQRASLLLPDVGGTLYYSNLRVYDLAGLTDRFIARTLPQDRHSFYNYIFETVKPTFIHTHGHWTHLAKLDDDRRFRRDYIPINEYVDTWVQSRSNETLYSGDFVRRDAVDVYNLESFNQIRLQVAK